MTTIQALLLGILQGLTEFLPISSSGHLVLGEHFMQLKISPQDLQGFDVLLHGGTALALLLCYIKEWWWIVTSFCHNDKPHLRLLAFILIATVPGAAAGVLFKDTISQFFRSPTSVACALLITAGFLIAGHMLNRGDKTEQLSWKHALAMGIAQAFALVPGLSRAGLTISAGQMAGVNRRVALDFSFLMALPIILGAMSVILWDVWIGTIVLPDAVVAWTGFISSSIVSALSILFLRQFVVKRSLIWFALYLVPVAVVVLGWELLL